MMNALPPQFDIPLHPNCVPLSNETKEIGLKGIEVCRAMLARAEKPKTRAAKVSLADKAIDMAGGSKAVEYAACLRQIESEKMT